MKNIFKFMGLALVAGALMVACNPDPVEPNDTTPNDTTPVTPASSVTIKWDNAVQTLGFIDAYQSDQDDRVFWLDAAKGLNGNSYVWPEFVAPLFNGTGGFYPAYCYQFINQQTGDTTMGNVAYPTEVYNEGGFEVNGELYGDYQLAQYDFNSINLTFDANTLTVSGRYSCTMFDYQAYQAGNVITKELEIVYDRYKFEAAK